MTALKNVWLNDSKTLRESIGCVWVKEHANFSEEDALNAKYSYEERKDLAEMLKEASPHNPHSKRLEENSYALSKWALTNDEYGILLEPLEDMPLHVNDSHADFRTIARWRLKCNK